MSVDIGPFFCSGHLEEEEEDEVMTAANSRRIQFFRSA